MQYTIRDGVRHSTAAAYLRPVEANEGLEIVTGAAARRLLFDGTRCVGVEWSTGTAHADQIVVCGGTIGSAQLLLLSGIGLPTICARSGSTSSRTCPGSARTCTTTFSRL